MCAQEMKERKNPNMRILDAIALILRFGWIDGEHHKKWVIDQVLRVLADDGYDDLVVDIDGHDVGIAP